MKTKLRLLPLLFLIVLYSGCNFFKPDFLKRDNLFDLALGSLENEVDVFLRGGILPKNKNRVYMCDGIVYLSNGVSGKVMVFTSFGDLLSLYYNPEKNPQPVDLSLKNEGESNKKAIDFPFNSPGEIAVTDEKFLYIEEQVEERRRVFEPSDGMVHDRIVLRFSPQGEYIGFIGQEGIEGSPFPLIKELYISKNDELMVLCMGNGQWSLYHFDKEGRRIGFYQIDEDLLPKNNSKSMVSVEGVHPDREGETIYFHVGYYEDRIDENTGASTGVRKVGNMVHNYNLRNKSFGTGFPMPVYREKYKGSGLVGFDEIEYPFDFLGIDGKDTLFFLTSGTTEYHTLLLLSPHGNLIDKKNLQIDNEEFFYYDFSIDEKGIITGFLVDYQKAHLVWWRGDKLKRE